MSHQAAYPGVIPLAAGRGIQIIRFEQELVYAGRLEGLPTRVETLIVRSGLSRIGSAARTLMRGLGTAREVVPLPGRKLLCLHP
jgi:hypothetical protein